MAQGVRYFSQPFVCATCLGLCLGLGFIWGAVWWLGLVGLALVPVFVGTVTKRQALLWGWWLGFVHSLCAMAWGLYVYPLDWLGIEGALANILIVTFFWFFSAAALSVGYGLWLFWLRTLSFENNSTLVIAPLGLVVAEIVGSVVYSITAMGPHIGVNAHFSFGYIGYLLANHDILGQFALLGGVYALSYISALVGFSMWRLYHRYGQWKYVGVMFVVVVATGLVVLPDPPPLVPTTGIHTEFPVVSERSRLEDQFRAEQRMEHINRAIRTGKEIIILSEDADLTTFLGGEAATMAYLQEEKIISDLILVDVVTVREENQPLISRAHIYDTKTNEVYYSDKEYLVQYGEYVPYFGSFLLSLFANEELQDDMYSLRAYGPGTQDGSSHPAHIPGVIMCSESVSPVILRQIAKERPMPVIAHPVSHGWFNNPWMLRNQLGMIIEVNARFAGVPVIVAVNSRPGTK